MKLARLALRVSLSLDRHFKGVCKVSRYLSLTNDGSFNHVSMAPECQAPRAPQHHPSCSGIASTARPVPKFDCDPRYNRDVPSIFHGLWIVNASQSSHALSLENPSLHATFAIQRRQGFTCEMRAMKHYSARCTAVHLYLIKILNILEILGMEMATSPDRWS